MGLRHRQGAGWAWFALLSAVALVLQAGAQQKVEELVVTGTKPDGTWTLHGMDIYCSQFAWGQEPPWCGGDDVHVGGPGEQDYAGVQDCSVTEDVDATCRCTGSMPQKVYNQNNGKFYCRSALPTAPCPQGQDFDYDPDVWGCVPVYPDFDCQRDRMLDSGKLGSVLCDGSGWQSLYEGLV